MAQDGMVWDANGTRQQNSASDGHKTQAGEGIRTPDPLFTRQVL